jgi:long-chain acyl-CoA synthetase
MSVGPGSREGADGIGSRFTLAVHRFADAPAVRVGDRTLDYTTLGHEVDLTCRWMAAAGVTHGRTVAICATNSVRFVTTVIALARLGATAVMLSTAWRENEIAHALALTDPSHVVHDGSGAVDLPRLAPRSTQIDLRRLQASSTDDLPSTCDRSRPDEVALVFFSSGTTGLPKAVRHTHGSLCAAIDHWATTLGLTQADRLQVATPPFHILGLLNVLTVLVHGASLRLQPRFDLDQVLAAIETDRITIEMAVAPIALAMAEHPQLERYDLSSLRYILWGATPVVPTVADTVTRRTGVRFLPGYGATELPVLAVNPVDRPAEWRLDSVGLPPAGVELRIVDPSTGEIVPPGQPGEIEGRSASMMLGYLPEEANRDAFRDGWYRTGDIGTIDADGWVTITDRLKEMIKVNGFQVAPAEIEALLLARPGIVDAAVFGVPHPTTGEAVVAAVVAADGVSVDTDALRAETGTQLARYKQIQEVVIVDRIPRLPSGKVLRRELRANHRS